MAQRIHGLKEIVRPDDGSTAMGETGSFFRGTAVTFGDTARDTGAEE